MKKATIIVLILSLVAISCKSKSTASTNKLKASNELVEILSGSHSNFDKRFFTEVNSAKELEELYKTLNKTRTPNYKLPNVDFSKEVVLGLFMGSKSSGGYAIKIDHIKTDGNYTAVFINEVKPTGMATSVITQPFYLAKMNKPTKPIRFITFN